MKPYEIYIAYVSWDSSGKNRPVLVLSSDGVDVGVFKITSQFSGKSAAIQAQYVAINDWAQAGLIKPSYIDVGKILELPIATVKPVPVGKLSANDLQRLLDVINV